MKSYTFTDGELEVLLHAINVINDIEEDTMFENTCDELYPTSDNPTVLTVEKASALREQLVVAMNRREARHSLMRKLGLTYNETTGYTV